MIHNLAFAQTADSVNDSTYSGIARLIDFYLEKNLVSVHNDSIIFSQNNLTHEKKLFYIKYTPVNEVRDVYIICFIYQNKTKKYEQIFIKSYNRLEYVDDTFRDVNNDKLKDLLIHIYPQSGCCKRDLFEVYLYSNDSTKFLGKLEFFNPTFIKDTNLIIGLSYGHSGSIPLYKRAIIGYENILLEEISPKENVGNFKFIKYDRNKIIQQKTINKIPDEYKKMNRTDLEMFFGLSQKLVI